MQKSVSRDRRIDLGGVGCRTRGQSVAPVPGLRCGSGPPTTPPCLTPGARPRTSSGRSTSPGWDGARRSSGATTSSSPPRSARVKSHSRSRACTTRVTSTERPMPWRHSGGWCTTSISRQAKVRWQQELHDAVPTIKRHLKASFASETTTTDGERVYVYLGSIGLVVTLDMTGTIVWSRDLGAFNGHQEFAPPRHQFCTRTVCTSSTTTRPSRF